MNVEEQGQASIAMGIGRALFKEKVLKEEANRTVKVSLHEYRIPLRMDTLKIYKDSKESSVPEPLERLRNAERPALGGIPTISAPCRMSFSCNRLNIFH